MKITAKEIINFWFKEIKEENWFAASEEFDLELRKKFFELHQHVAAAEAYIWRNNAHGRLAEIIVLDQFSRQLFRGKAQAFANDNMALALAQELVARGDDLFLDEKQRMFAYMPYMHSESLAIHEEAMRLYKALGNKEALKFEIAHKQVIEKFGRYPLRNKALGRKSTKQELIYIAGKANEHF